MNNKLKIKDGSGEWVEPFKLRVNVGKVSCKFCQADYEKRHHCNRDFTSAQRKEFQIKDGEKALRLTINNGPTGTAYICLKCAYKLLENLKREINKVNIPPQIFLEVIRSIDDTKNVLSS